MVLSKTSAFGVWMSVLVAAGLAASLTVLTAFASDAGAIPNANKATSGTQAASCTGDIVLDPGHGGADSGALNSKYKLTEKDQTLAVANKLKGLLQTDDPENSNDHVHTVCMTRTGDQTLSNSDRYTYANTTGAKVLLSIHMNGSTNPATDYTTTLFGKWQKDKELAQTLFKSLSQLTVADGRGTIATRTPYSYASGVLLKSNMPASIAETVFITNDKEGQLLSDGTGNRQQDIAEQLEEGIENYFSTH
jgi:N-acetylmuramoyl-L-alanine amidase